jgi:hypothetical protein
MYIVHYELLSLSTQYFSNKNLVAAEILCLSHFKRPLTMIYNLLSFRLSLLFCIQSQIIFTNVLNIFRSFAVIPTLG